MCSLSNFGISISGMRRTNGWWKPREKLCFWSSSCVQIVNGTCWECINSFRISYKNNNCQQQQTVPQQKQNNGTSITANSLVGKIQHHLLFGRIDVQSKMTKPQARKRLLQAGKRSIGACICCTHRGANSLL